jgi:hypothetical protein
MSSVANKPFMSIAVMLIVVMLNVVAPCAKDCQRENEKNVKKDYFN